VGSDSLHMRTWRYGVMAAAVSATALLFYTWRSASAHAHPRVHGGPEQEEPAPAEQLDLARADAMREQLRALFSEVGPVGRMGAAETAPAPAPSEASESGAFEADADYVMFVLQRDFVPLALDCYKRALGRTPGLAGRVWMRVDVIGDNGGGVVGDTSIEGAPLGDAKLQVCLRESMRSVSFDAPPENRALSTSVSLDLSDDGVEPGPSGGNVEPPPALLLGLPGRASSQ
jgi:hypothetical protein